MVQRRDVHILRGIVDVAQSLARTTSTVFSRSLSSSGVPQRSSELPSHRHVLPNPKPLTSTLTALGLRSSIAEQISTAYMQAALQLKRNYEIQYQQTSRVYAQKDPSGRVDYEKLRAMLQTAVSSVYTKSLQSWTDDITEKIRIRVSQIRQPSRDSYHQAKRPFNFNAIPLLEQAFESNARPSQAEKKELATKTGMEYRQINVWFQNRRTRTKKEHKDTIGSKYTIPTDLETSVTKILSSAEGCDVVEMIGHDTNYFDQSSVSEPADGFNLKRPLHAYPSSYPPACSYNPFPTERSFSTPWIRKASLPCNDRSAPVDVVQLADHLKMLSLVDKPLTSMPQRVEVADVPAPQRHTRTSCLASFGFVTIVPPAPLPSLLSFKAFRPISFASPGQNSPTSRPISTKTQPSAPSLQTCNPSIIQKKNNSGTKRKTPDRLKRSPKNMANCGVPAEPTSAITSPSHPRRTEVGASTGVNYLSPIHQPIDRQPRIPGAVLRSSSPSPSDPAFKSDPSTVHCADSSHISLSSHSPRASRIAPSNRPSRRDHVPPSIAPYPPRGSTPRRKGTALPRRRLPSILDGDATAMRSEQQSSLHPLSRMSSVSSLRSVSSGESSSSESEAPLTPPLLPISLHDCSIVTSPLAPDSSDYYSGQSSVEYQIHGENPQVDFLPPLDFGQFEPSKFDFDGSHPLWLTSIDEL